MDTPVHPHNSSDASDEQCADDAVLGAMKAARRILRALESRRLPNGYRFHLQQDDLNGWPRLRVRLYASNSSKPELPSLSAYVEQGQKDHMYCLYHQGTREPEKVDLSTALAIEEVPRITEKAVQHFIELVESFVSNTPLSGKLDQPDLVAAEDEDFEEEPAAPAKIVETNLDFDDDFFKSEQDFHSLREEMLTSNSFQREDLEPSSTSVLTRRSTEEIEAEKLEKSPEKSASVSFDPGSVIADRYKIVRRIGRGGMGTVYLVQDQILEGEEVAMKVLASEYVDQQGYIKRFLREVQLMRRINHPNVARTYDVMVNDDLVFFTMEYVTGRPLSDVLDKGRGLKKSEWVEFIRQVCEGLSAIHAANIIHRDLTPGNILLFEDGSLKIIDFGVARPDQSQFTMHQEIIGSITYIAPEIWQGQEATPAIDFYSFGVILYEIATGVIPFEGNNIPDTMRLHVSGEVDPPSKRKKGVPKWISELTMRLLEKDPKKRPESADAILSLLPK